MLLDFLHGLLTYDPRRGLTPQEAKTHPFITGQVFTEPYNPAAAGQHNSAFNNHSQRTSGAKNPAEPIPTSLSTNQPGHSRESSNRQRHGRGSVVQMWNLVSTEPLKSSISDNIAPSNRNNGSAHTTTEPLNRKFHAANLVHHEKNVSQYRRRPIIFFSGKIKLSSRKRRS